MKRYSVAASKCQSHLTSIRPRLIAVENVEKAPKEPDIPETVTGWLRSLGYAENPQESNQPELKVIQGGRGQ